MPALVPARFLVRVAHPCPFVAAMPTDDADRLLDLPPAAALNTFAALDGQTDYADVRIAWNDLGIGVQVTVTGKKQPPGGDVNRPRSTDGLTVWLDTRGDRTSHRATRTCHQFHLLAAGGGADKDEPAFAQSKINRALADAPLADPATVPFRGERTKTGYRLEAFLPVAILTGYDPEQYPKLGVYYVVHDGEQGDQPLAVGSDFPFWDDPSLWATLELVK
jgi:hypothetical protein